MLLSHINKINLIIKTYTPLINLAWSFLPFVLAIFMAFIAYEQYKLANFLEFKKMRDELEKSFDEKVIHKFLDEIFNIILEKDNKTNKQEEILKNFDEIAKISSKYEHFLEYSDIQLLKQSYKKVKQWIKEDTLNFKYNLKNIFKAFDIWTEFLSFIFYSDCCIIKQPNKHLTIYAFIGALLKRFYTFFMPYFLQIKIKRYLLPKLFRIKAFFCLVKFISSILSSSDKKEIKEKNKKLLEDKNVNDNLEKI